MSKTPYACDHRAINCTNVVTHTDSKGYVYCSYCAGLLSKAGRTGIKKLRKARR
jgi:hypothetical protein